MNKTNIFLLIFLAVSALVFQSSCTRKAPEPNVVLIVLDTLRADHLPFYGYKKNTAPFLSRLASDGVVFENVFAASSWTGPATASIFTAMYPFQHGLTTGFWASKFHKTELDRIPEEIKTITEVLKENGYKTYGAADNVNICEEEGFTQGFDRYKLFKYAHEKKMDLQLDQWAEEIKKQKKYFLFIQYNDCHIPYHKREPWYEPGKNKPQDIIARYDSEISYVDAKIKKMYERYGWDKNTLIIVTADHGEAFGDHGKAGHGHSLYSEEIRVPLLIYFPGKDRKGKRVKMNAGNIDILPTVRSYLGIEPSRVEAGADLMPLINDTGGNKEVFQERYLFSHLYKRNRSHDGTTSYHKATIYKDWKYIFVDKFQKSYKRELFNLEADGKERLNQYKENKALANGLFAKFTEFEKKSKKFKQQRKTMNLDKKKMEELKSLGYVQ
ncbi:MAG: sulfatase [bacterium]|nr:sulfatase [bacterium]